MNKNSRDSFKENSPFNQDGQTLLEMVAAIGIILIIAVLGISGYSTINGASKQAAVNKAADVVYNKAYPYAIDGDSSTNPKNVGEEYMFSQKGKQDIIVLVQHPYGGDTNRIKVTAMMGDYTAVKITPGSKNSSIPDDGSAPIPVVDDDTLTNFTYKCEERKIGYLPILNIGENTKVYMWETSNKNATFKEVKYSAPTQAMIDAGDSFLRSETREEMARTKVLYDTDWNWSKVYELVGEWDKSKHTAEQKEFYSVKNVVQNVSEQIVFEPGINYSIMYDGDVETFAAPGNQAYSIGGNTGAADCLTSIDNLGNSTSLRNIIYIGGENLVDVPKSIPSTVINLRGAFENAVGLNDPDIIEWDTSNIISLRSTFYQAKSFNQPIGKWDTSNLIVSHMTFSGASSFNQNLNGWNTENLQFAAGMFGKAEQFNNGCQNNDFSCSLKWDTSSLIDASTMFSSASSFNQELGSTVNESGKNYYWSNDQLTNLTGAFTNATSFNNGCPVNSANCDLKLITDSVVQANNMFKGATVFNQNISSSIDEDLNNEYWNLSNANTLSAMFANATSFNNGDEPRLTNSDKALNWDLRSNSNFSSFFLNAESFNQDITSLLIKSVSNKGSFHKGSGLTCQNIHPSLKTATHCSG